MPRPLDGDCHRSLVLGAGAKLAPRLDFATLRQMPAKTGNVLVINFVDFINAERAYLAAGHKPAATTTSASSARAISTLTIAPAA